MSRERRERFSIQAWSYIVLDQELTHFLMLLIVLIVANRQRFIRWRGKVKVYNSFITFLSVFRAEGKLCSFTPPFPSTPLPHLHQESLFADARSFLSQFAPSLHTLFSVSKVIHHSPSLPCRRNIRAMISYHHSLLSKPTDRAVSNYALPHNYALTLNSPISLRSHSLEHRSLRVFLWFQNIYESAKWSAFL